MIARFAAEAGPTVQWLKRAGVRFDFLRTQFLIGTQPRPLPVGGGLALVEALAGNLKIDERARARSRRSSDPRSVRRG
jgi:hypothetical protein